MANLNLGQDVANKMRKKIDSCSYCGQILYLIAAVKLSRYGSLINIHPSDCHKLNTFFLSSFFNATLLSTHFIFPVARPKLAVI